jgi:hypothetical protein
MSLNVPINTYITTLIEEKGHSVDEAIVLEGHYGLTWAMLIEKLTNDFPENHEEIHDKLTFIDFQNGDVFHFLTYLAKYFIQPNDDH